MAKRKKKMKIAAEKITDENQLADELKKVTEGLYYMSESDAEIYPFAGKKVETITKSELLDENKSPIETPVEERDFAEFFDYLTKFQDWFGEEEKNTARKYRELKELLENNLKCLRVYKIGKIELDIYIVGLDYENKIVGVRTKAIET